MSRLCLALFQTACLIALTGSIGCGGDDDDGSTADSGTPPPDAARPDAGAPDAQACALTMCGDECVDTETSSAHCGGCDQACDSPGQICSGALPCACPEGFIPAEPVSVFDDVDDQIIPGVLVGLDVLSEGGVFNALLVAFTEDTPINTEFDLAEVTPPATPFVAAAYDVDPSTMAIHTAYLATTGTISFTEVCAAGIRGTLTDATLVEIGGVSNPVPVEGGCTFTVPSAAIVIGDSCAGAPDAGPGAAPSAW